MCSNIFPAFESELELGWVTGTGAGVTDVRVLARSGKLALTSHTLEENFRWIEQMEILEKICKITRKIRSIIIKHL